MKGELVAKVKFWFGNKEPIFNERDYIIESHADKNYVCIYERVK